VSFVIVLLLSDAQSWGRWNYIEHCMTQLDCKTHMIKRDSWVESPSSHKLVVAIPRDMSVWVFALILGCWMSSCMHQGMVFSNLVQYYGLNQKLCPTVTCTTVTSLQYFNPVKYCCLGLFIWVLIRSTLQNWSSNEESYWNCVPSVVLHSES
jgi:hypothetical protein